MKFGVIQYGSSNAVVWPMPFVARGRRMSNSYVVRMM